MPACIFAGLLDTCTKNYFDVLWERRRSVLKKVPCGIRGILFYFCWWWHHEMKQSIAEVSLHFGGKRKKWKMTSSFLESLRLALCSVGCFSPSIPVTWCPYAGSIIHMFNNMYIHMCIIYRLLLEVTQKSVVCSSSGFCVKATISKSILTQCLFFMIAWNVNELFGMK